jgi:hypothetical protein
MPKAPAKKSKTKIPRTPQELNEINKAEMGGAIDTKPPPVLSNPHVQVALLQKQSAGMSCYCYCGTGIIFCNIELSLPLHVDSADFKLPLITHSQCVVTDGYVYASCVVKCRCKISLLQKNL